MSDIYITFATSSYLNSALVQRCYFKLLGQNHILFTQNNLPEELKGYSVDNPRGYGFWRWKPYLIFNVFKLLEQGDRVFWVDAGCLPLASFKRLDFQNVFVQKNIFSDPRKWCKPGIKCLLNQSDQFFANGAIPDASVIGIVKSRQSENFLQRWLDLCNDHRLISDDQFDTSNECSEKFIDHRHDQALLGYVSFEFDVKQSDSITQYGTGELIVYHHRTKINSILKLSRVVLGHLFCLASNLFAEKNTKMIKLSKKNLY